MAHDLRLSPINHHLFAANYRCVVAGIWGLRSGTVTLETSQVFAALMGDAPRSMTMVVTEWRLPRVLMALLIGAAWASVARFFSR